MEIRQQMRSLMVRHSSEIRQRQQSMLLRAAAGVGLAVDHLDGHTGDIQGKLRADTEAYSRSPASLS